MCYQLIMMQYCCVMNNLSKRREESDMIRLKGKQTLIHNSRIFSDQRTNGPVNAHLISWPSKAQNIQNLEKYMVKK